MGLKMAADALVAVGCQSILPALEVVQMLKHFLMFKKQTR